MVQEDKSSSDRWFNKPKDEESVEKVNKTKKKPNKKKERKAAMPAFVDEEESDEDNSDSEEPSPVKHQSRVARAEIEKGAITKRSLADKINEMDPAEGEDFQNQMQHAFTAKAARSGDNAHLPCKVYNKQKRGEVH